MGGQGWTGVPGSRPTHSSPVGFRGPLRWSGPLPRANAASWPILARFDLILLNYSQNARVSPKYVNKACHSPYLQNGLQKSALQILRFPYFVAFSHKELMGLFWPRADFIVKMMKCRQNVHTRSREVVADTPTDHASKLAPVVGSSSAQRGILIGLVLRRFAPDYD